MVVAQKKYIFRKRPGQEQIISSAVALAKLVLQDSQGVLEKHRRELLDKLIWKITEAESMNKLRTRFCSLEAFSLPDARLEHEHVYEKGKLVSELLSGIRTPEEILSVAVACVVTEQEHRALSAVSDDLHGWDRYMAARIPVVDVRETQKRGELVMFLDPR